MSPGGGAAACLACGDPLRVERPYAFASAAFRRIYHDASVYRCAGCDVVQADARAVDVAALSGYYAHDYRAVAKLGVAPDEAGLLWYQARGAALAELAARYGPPHPRRAFELGAGYGYNLASLRDAFHDLATFTDEADRSLDQGRSVARAAIDDGPWDVLILSHVLEHFTDPVSLLRTALSQLAPDGVLLVEVPNDRPGIIPLNGPDEPHLVFLTEATLRAVLDRAEAGEVVDVFTAGPRNTTRSAMTQTRLALLRLAIRTPLVGRVASARRSGQASGLDFRPRTEDGVFLRAVVRREPWRDGAG